MEPRYDIAIIGAGPAGLSAALYAARFCRSTIVLHDGAARAARIPRTFNVPGFDGGVAGPDLLERMARHATEFGAKVVETRIVAAQRDKGSFVLTGLHGTKWRARSVILATGLTLNEIPIDRDLHEAAIGWGVLRYCPVCDGYEHQGNRLGVVGCDISGAAEALFLRQYSDDVTLLPRRDVELTPEECADLSAAGVATVLQPIVRYQPCPSHMAIYVEGRAEPLIFDVIYPALGVTPRNELATSLALPLIDTGKAAADSPFATIVPGLYCAGDIVDGLDQISVAMGHGAIAATKAHNWLRANDGETVQAVLEDAS